MRRADRFGRAEGGGWHPPRGMAGGAFWLAVCFGVVWLLRQVPGAGSSVLGWAQFVVGVGLIGLAAPLLWRLIHKHLLWSLRNKLILTYLLIGLAPFALVVTFVTISAYIAAGQFSIHLADTRMRQELDQMGRDNSTRAERVTGFIRRREEGGSGSQRGGRNFEDRRRARPAGVAQETAAATEKGNSEVIGAEAALSAVALPDPLRARLHPHTAVYLNGAPLESLPGFALPPSAAFSVVAKTPLGLPAWAANLHGREFRGLVVDDGELYLVAIDQRHVGSGAGLVSVITSLPVDSALLDVVAKGLGQVHLAGLATADELDEGRQGAGVENQVRREAARLKHLQVSSAYGGVEPVSVNVCDFRVSFLSTLDTVDWDSGEAARMAAAIRVHSRPSLLYRQLFGSSLSGVITSYIRYGLIALCVVFALLEAWALWAALRLSKSITTAVEELHAATQRVDRGDMVHRVPAAQTWQQDQLGELARSFNGMIGSLERLLAEQHEKERLQSELTIAQEVQANLFPHHVRSLPTLELHGVCRPARSVSGDYYDFLVFHHPDNADGSRGREAGVGIALGDISGKGISAALLMATLHSAVRAYQLAGEDLVYSDSSFAGLMASREGRAGDGGKLFSSPGQILSMLNRHLYRSTQPEKYATLFLAHYDSDAAQLTYSNAGHLPPFVLGRDGTVRRLDCGGTVVGLMDGMRYEEGSVALRPGDLLVAYSDGITEPENDFGEFGEERLLEVVARYRDQPLHVISAQVMLALDAWIGAEEQPDDITLVLARQV
ncbi:MAG TPA: SpoIIE family protein phosphatase [Acidobacteriaceae bacterium]|nr:SpoIIE family protein phosphatase [Acidobacteriaceae bacterium]